jgi:hypothetical protein
MILFHLIFQIFTGSFHGGVFNKVLCTDDKEHQRYHSNRVCFPCQVEFICFRNQYVDLILVLKTALKEHLTNQ